MAQTQNPEFLETRSIGRLLFEFSLPAVTAAFVMATYNLVARVFVGQCFGTDGLAAVTVAFPVILIFLAIAMTIGTGATIIISIKLGERNNDKAEEALGQALFLSVATSILFVVFGIAFMEPLLRLFGATENVLPMAKSYLAVLIWGVFPQHIAYGVNNFIRAEGKPKIAMVSMFIAAIVNAALDWFFLFYLKTGIWGAGLANVLACCVSAVWICWLYFSGRTTLRWRWKYCSRFNWKLTKEIAILGGVPFATQACAMLLSMAQNNLLGQFGRKYGEAMGYAFDGGDVAVAVMGIAIAIANAVLMPFLGLGQGLQPIVGYNVGAKRPDRVLAALSLALKAVVVAGFAAWFVLIVWPTPFVKLFLNSNAEGYAEKLALGASAIRAVMCGLPFVGVNILAGGYFQAHGRPILALMLTLLRQLLFLLPCLYFLPRLFEACGVAGLNGCWFSFPVSDALAFAIAAGFLVAECRAKKKEIAEFRRSKAEEAAQTGEAATGA